MVFTAHIAFARTAQEAASYINQFPVLRIGMAEGTGNGHQAITISVINRLRQIGYRGHIELYYHANCKKKLEYLLPPFWADGDDHQVIKRLDVETFKLNESPAERLPLGILAGDNYNLRIQDLNVDNLLIIHPPNWGRRPNLKTQKLNFEFEKIAISSPLQIEPPNVANIQEFLTLQMGAAPKLRSKIAGIENLLENQKAEAVSVLFAYGLGVRGQGKLATLLAGLRLAQKIKPELFPRPIVIGLISNVNDEEWAQVRHALDLNTGANHWLRLFDVQDPNLRTLLKEASLDTISVIRIGNVTQDVWNFLMERSDLPPLVAGANGVTHLLRQGRPFAATSDDSLSDGFTSLPSSQYVNAQLYDTWQALEGGQVLAFAGWLIRAVTPNSQLARHFREQGAYSRVMPDRLCEALLATNRVLTTLQQKKPSTKFSKNFFNWLRSVR